MGSGIASDPIYSTSAFDESRGGVFLWRVVFFWGDDFFVEAVFFAGYDTCVNGANVNNLAAKKASNNLTLSVKISEKR